MTSARTIVFGPTGSVGSGVASFAQQHGAKVFLAMRDTKKPIPNLSLQAEQEGSFERVYADLTKPETVDNAVIMSRAKRAFIYLDFSSDNGMISTITALKTAGVEFVVFLSSASVPEDMVTDPAANLISHKNAQVELSLKEVFGARGYVAVRPGHFTTNILPWIKMIQDGEVKIPYPEAIFDWITPEDIAEVCGALLVKGLRGFGQSPGYGAFRLSGPELISLRDAVNIIAKTTGRKIKVRALDDQESVELFMASGGLPEHLARTLVKIYGDCARLGRDYYINQSPEYENAVANIRIYSGREPTTFQRWVEDNKEKLGI